MGRHPGGPGLAAAAVERRAPGALQRGDPLVEGRPVAREPVRGGPGPGARRGHRRSRDRPGPGHRPGQHALAGRGVVRHLPPRVPRRDAGLRLVVDAGAAEGRLPRPASTPAASTGIRMLEQARVAARGTYDLPDQIWVGDWNQRHDTGSVHVARDGWPRGRVHQYSGNHPETYGGVTLRVDSNFMDVGHGTVAPADGTRCPRDVGYPTLREGDRSPSVPVLQCLLGQRRLLRSDTSSRYYSSTARDVTALQRSFRAAGDRGCRPAHLGGAAERRLASLAEVRVCRRRRTAPAARPRRGGKRRASPAPGCSRSTPAPRWCATNATTTSRPPAW